MAFSYKPLWKLLIDKDMSKTLLIEKVGISKSTINKMTHGEIVSMTIIDKLCDYFDCSINDIVEHVRKIQ